MGESANKRVLSPPVKRAGVIAGIAGDLPIKEVDFANKAKGNSSIKRGYEKIKTTSVNTYHFKWAKLNNFFKLSSMILCLNYS